MTATVSAVPLPELLIELGPLGLSGAIGGGIVAVANHLFTSRRERGAWLEVGRSQRAGMMKICYRAYRAAVRSSYGQVKSSSNDLVTDCWLEVSRPTAVPVIL